MSERLSSIQPRRDMGADDFDALRRVLAGVIEAQREIVARLDGDGTGELLAKLDGLAETLADVRQGAGKRIDGLTVEELAVAEPDGTVRFIATSAAREPRGRGGLLFFTQEGRECGGLSYGAGIDGERFDAGMILTMDQFRQDQLLALKYSDWNGQRSAGFYVWDRPDLDLEEVLDRVHEVQAMDAGPEKDEAWDRLMKECKLGNHWPTRLFAGRNQDNDAAIELHDLDGRVRLRLMVSSEGAAKLEFLDEDGHAVKALTPLE